MFIIALFTIAKKWKQPIHLSVDKWIKKMWYIHAMEYCLAMRKKETVPFATACKNLEVIMLSEISEIQIPCNIIYTWKLKKLNL